MWERFSYYGMRAILVLYLTNFLLLSGQAEHVAGYHALKGAFEWLVGRQLGVQPFSSMIYGGYTALVYLTPFFGGIIADRWLGQRYQRHCRRHPHGDRRIHADGAVAVLSRPCCLLIIGNGFFKPNISTQVGNLYKPGDSRIDRAYSIFYVGINVGAILVTAHLWHALERTSAITGVSLPPVSAWSVGTINLPVGIAHASA